MFCLICTAGLERSFNGLDAPQFAKLCKPFFDKTGYQPTNYRLVPEVLINSLNDCIRSTMNLSDSNVRFKLIIDETDDSSGSRLLNALFRVAEWSSNRGLEHPTADHSSEDIKHFAEQMPRAVEFYGSSFDGDEDSKTDLINTIILAMENGDTVVMANAASLHASFYGSLALLLVCCAHFAVLQMCSISTTPAAAPTRRAANDLLLTSR